MTGPPKYFNTSSGIVRYTVVEALGCLGHTGEPFIITPGHSFDRMRTAEVTNRSAIHTSGLFKGPIIRAVKI